MSQNPSPTKRERREAARAQRLERERAAAAADARRRRLLQLGGLLAAAGVIVVLAIVLSSGGGSKNASGGGAVNGAAAAQKVFAGIPQQGVTLGSASAPVTVVEFADPQCPFCRDYTLNEMPQIVQKYVRTGKVKAELRMLAFIGPDSEKAARVLAATSLQNLMWNATDVFYANQGQENSGYVTDAFLRKVLGAVPGLDVQKALSQAGSPEVTAELGTARTMANRYGVSSTPTFLVGSGTNLQKVTSGTLPAAIDAALAKVKPGA